MIDNVELKHLLTCNFINDKFNRVDVLVIKHSIEQYLKNEKYDFDIYIKMQIHRGNQRAQEDSGTAHHLLIILIISSRILRN